MSSPPAGTRYFEARELFGAAGIPLVEARAARTATEACAAADELGYPVVLKALGRPHKSDTGGIVLGIKDEAELERVFSDLATRLSPEEYSVERTAPAGRGVELILGCRRDRRFGPIALAGLGGLHAELLEDTAVALAPIGADEACALIRSLRGAPLLLGARGRPALDIRAAAAALASLSCVAASHPEIAELEINPLLMTPEAVLGLDVRIVVAENGGE